MREVHGLDISDEDLVFAMQAAAPPEPEEEDNSEMGLRLRSLTAGGQRWEALSSKVWKGGLEVINEEFRDIECIVGMEVYMFLYHSSLSFTDSHIIQDRASAREHSGHLCACPPWCLSSRILAHYNAFVHFQR